MLSWLRPSTRGVAARPAREQSNSVGSDKTDPGTFASGREGCACVLCTKKKCERERCKFLTCRTQAEIIASDTCIYFFSMEKNRYHTGAPLVCLGYLQQRVHPRVHPYFLPHTPLCATCKTVPALNFAPPFVPAGGSLN